MSRSNCPVALARRRRTLILVGLLAAFPVVRAGAAEVAGVRFDEAAVVRGHALSLNGAAIRTMAMFRVYAIALYMRERTRDAQRVMAVRMPKRIVLAMLREITAKQLAEALVEGVRDNHSAAETERLRPRLDRLVEAMTAVGRAPAGTRITMDFVPGEGTVFAFEGRPVGEPIEGDDFFAAILAIWFGPRPVDTPLRDALLGRGA